MCFPQTLLECDNGGTLTQEPLDVALVEVVPDDSWLWNKGANAGRGVRRALTSANNDPEKSCTSYLLVY